MKKVGITCATKPTLGSSTFSLLITTTHNHLTPPSPHHPHTHTSHICTYTLLSVYPFCLLVFGYFLFLSLSLLCLFIIFRSLPRTFKGTRTEHPAFFGLLQVAKEERGGTAKNARTSEYDHEKSWVGSKMCVTVCEWMLECGGAE